MIKNSGINKSICLIVFFSFSPLLIQAQANGFGLKTGPSMGFQKWGGNNQSDPLLRWHVAAFIDSESSDSKNVIYGQLGYHIKGQGIRFAYTLDQHGNIGPGSTYGMEFHNLSLDIGLKRFISKNNKWRPYYAIGLRGEYTMKADLQIFPEYKEFVCKWNYGFSVKIGSEFKFRKLVYGGIELNIAPDLSNQIYVPASIKRYDPFTNQVYPGYEQSSKNTTVELSFYLRFLQVIEYVD